MSVSPPSTTSPTGNDDTIAIEKPYLELYVKASAIDQRRIGACLFCQEFWMELYALYELGLVRVEVKTVNVNSEPFKRHFLGAQPPIMIETNRKLTYTDNRDLEGRIFHIAKDFRVPLFEKDVMVEKRIETLFRNFKVYLRAMVESRQQSKTKLSPAAETAQYKLFDQLKQIDHDQLNLTSSNRESLQTPTKTHTIPEDVLAQLGAQ